MLMVRFQIERDGILKVTVNAKGDVTLDISNGEAQAALDFIRALQSEQRIALQANPFQGRQRVTLEVDDPKPQALQPISKGTRPGVHTPHDGALNRSQYDAWEYLAENDCEVGVHLNALGRHLNISSSAAGQRCYTLIKLGYARRVAMGRYRALTP